MNIQIFGKSKSFDTKKAERYFKERGIKFQSVDLPTKGLSKGELNSVLAAVGDIDKLIDPKAKGCLLYTSPSPRDMRRSRMPSSA